MEQEHSISVPFSSKYLDFYLGKAGEYVKRNAVIITTMMMNLEYVFVREIQTEMSFFYSNFAFSSEIITSLRYYATTATLVSSGNFNDLIVRNAKYYRVLLETI